MNLAALRHGGSIRLCSFKFYAIFDRRKFNKLLKKIRNCDINQDEVNMGLQSMKSEEIAFYAREILKKIETNYRIIPINSLRNKQYSLKSPIYITIEYEDEHVIASFDDVEAFGYADNEFEAVDLLCKEIVILHEDLKKNKESLGVLPQKWLSILENFIQCN